MALSPFTSKQKLTAKATPTIPIPSQGPAQKFGMLQPQEVVLGLFGEYVSSGEQVWSGGLVELLGDLGFSAASSRIALNRILVRGLLSAAKVGRFVFYRGTPRLAIVQDEGRRQTFQPTAEVEWDGQFTLVWYSIPGDQRPQRARLGRWLNFRGFGALQDGTWIAAGDCERDLLPLISRLELEQHVVIFVGKLVEATNIPSLVRRAWHVDDLAKMYRAFVDEFSSCRGNRGRKVNEPRNAFILRTRLIEMFRQTTVQDPHLPDSVARVVWKRREAVELFQELQQSLREPAQSYFRQRAINGEQLS